MNPKVFVSHASADKERFVLGFATKLRERGIDAWLDRWEMLPGDSLVDKIFEEGIKNAQAVIVVISANSINKPWVREELNAGLVKRISEGTKLIPIVIDDCAVPAALTSTLWVKVKDLDSYEPEFESIVASIFGHQFKPPLGSPPKYVQAVGDLPSGLTEIDALVLKVGCERAIEQGHSHVAMQAMEDVILALGISNNLLTDSLDVLETRGYLNLTRAISGRILLIRITLWGFERYLEAFLADYQEFRDDVIGQIVNGRLSSDKQIAEALGRPVKLVDHVIESLGGRGLVQVIRLNGGRLMLHSPSAELKRMIS